MPLVRTDTYPLDKRAAYLSDVDFHHRADDLYLADHLSGPLRVLCFGKADLRLGLDGASKEHSTRRVLRGDLSDGCPISNRAIATTFNSDNPWFSATLPRKSRRGME